MRSGYFNFLIFGRLRLMGHRVDKALRIDLVLQHRTPVPRLIDGTLIRVPKLLVRVNLNFAVNELPPRQSAHCCNETESRIVAVDKLPFRFALKAPLSVAFVRDLGVEEQQLDQFSIAVIRIIAEGFSTTIR